MWCPGGIYIMTNSSHSVFYMGASMLVPERVLMHQEGRSDGFAKKYKCTKLVYYEILLSRDAAYRREKELKGWRRQKKMALITIKNPSGRDLSEDFVREARELMR